MKSAVTQYRCDIALRNIVVGLVCWVHISACGGPSAGPEAQLRSWVIQGQAATESKERRKLVGMISRAYEDARGNDAADIENMFRVYFFRQSSIKLLTSIDAIRLYGDSAAEIDLTVGMAGKNDGVLGFSADAYKFRLELERNDDEWLLISARWGELGKDLH